MTRIMITTTWLICFIWMGLGASEATAKVSAGYALQAAPGAWQSATQRPLRAGQLRPSLRHLELPGEAATPSAKADPSADFGTLRQHQTAPPPPGGFLTPGSPSFYLFVLDMSMLVGSVVVSIGSSVVASTGGDLTGWKVAGLVIDGIGLVSAIGLIATVDMSQLPSFFPIIIYVSMGLSALSFIWGVVKLVMYINRRNKLKERKEREMPAGPPEKRKAPPVVVLPWGGVDRDGNPVGGLAMVGRF